MKKILILLTVSLCLNIETVWAKKDLTFSELKTELESNIDDANAYSICYNSVITNKDEKLIVNYTLKSEKEECAAVKDWQIEIDYQDKKIYYSGGGYLTDDTSKSNNNEYLFHLYELDNFWIEKLAEIYGYTKADLYKENIEGLSVLKSNISVIYSSSDESGIASSIRQITYLENAGISNKDALSFLNVTENSVTLQLIDYSNLSTANFTSISRSTDGENYKKIYDTLDTEYKTAFSDEGYTDSNLDANTTYYYKYVIENTEIIRTVKTLEKIKEEISEEETTEDENLETEFENIKFETIDTKSNNVIIKATF